MVYGIVLLMIMILLKLIEMEGNDTARLWIILQQTWHVRNIFFRKAARALLYFY
jgi:hypothetical protein